jgi:AraC-like DNA-binding protein
MALPELEAVVWRLLDQHPGRRPTLEEVARDAHRSALDMRRANLAVRRIVATTFGQRAFKQPTCRDMISYACLTYSTQLIRGGTKIEASMRLAGFRSWSHFSRKCQDYFLCQPHELRHWPTS